MNKESSSIQVVYPEPHFVRHSDHSKLPDSINVIGKIQELTPGYCGYFCFGGSIKVKLENHIENYNNDYAYVVTACMKQGVKIGTKVNLIASKLTNADTTCYYLTNTGSVDSHGFPFYKLDESETNKIQ